MLALFLKSSSSVFCHSEESNDEESCGLDSFASHLRSFAKAQDDILLFMDSSLCSGWWGSMSVSFRGSEAAEESTDCHIFLDSSPSVQNDGEINE